jgi:hypothetical protein
VQQGEGLFDDPAVLAEPARTFLSWLFVPSRPSGQRSLVGLERFICDEEKEKIGRVHHAADGGNCGKRIWIVLL